MPDQQQPVTRAEFDAGIATLKSELKSEIAETKSELIEAMRDMQTEVLRAFHGWARPAEIRMNSLTTNVQGYDERLALLEQRVSRIEGERLGGQMSRNQ